MCGPASHSHWLQHHTSPLHTWIETCTLTNLRIRIPKNIRRNNFQKAEMHEFEYYDEILWRTHVWDEDAMMWLVHCQSGVPARPTPASAARMLRWEDARASISPPIGLGSWSRSCPPLVLPMLQYLSHVRILCLLIISNLRSSTCGYHTTYGHNCNLDN